MLSDIEIIESLKRGDIKIYPGLNGECINGVSLDFRLGNKFMVWQSDLINCQSEFGMSKEKCIEKGVRLNETIWTYKERYHAADSGMYGEPVPLSFIEKLMSTVHVDDGEEFSLEPSQMVLAETVERLTLGNNVAAKVSGRSSLGRLGLIVHITADLFAPGWDGVPVLELKNVGPHTLILKPGMAICSFSFYKLSGNVSNGYSGRYVGQDGVTVSR